MEENEERKLTVEFHLLKNALNEIDKLLMQSESYKELIRYTKELNYPAELSLYEYLINKELSGLSESKLEELKLENDTLKKLMNVKLILHNLTQIILEDLIKIVEINNRKEMKNNKE